MRYSEVKSIASCWIITSSLIFLLLLSILHWYTDSESNRCILTRMMDIPMFEKIHVDCQHKCYIDYGLYRYQEGSRFRFRPYNMPVLFVTGSQGSFRTVRSLASTMLSFVRDNSPFDYYTVDLNEEVSAVSGEIIERQTEFVDKAIDTILRMYTKRPNSSKHVVLIGHSVGSVVIFNLLSSRWSLNQTKVKLVFSLASPIRQPIILSDRILAHIYQRMHNYLNRISKIPNYPLVILSITGGSRDKLVPDLFGNLDQDYPGLNSLSISSSAIQHVWASCDHRCILWCLQLMLVLNKCLLEHQSLSDSPKLRLNGFRDLLITKPLMTNAYSDGRANSFEESILKTSHSVASQMLWIDKTYQINTVMRFHVPLTGQLVKLGPFFQDVKQSVLLLVTNAPEDWLHLCIKTDDDNGKHCDYFIPIESSTYLTWLPDPLTRRSMAAGMITLSTLKSLPLLNHHSLGYDSKIYLVVSTGSNPSRNSMTIFLETFNKDSERRIHSNLPDYSTLQSFIYPNWLITLKPQLSGVFHRFYLPQEKYYLSSSTLTPKLLIKRRNCSLDKQFMGMITMNTLWCNYFHYVAIEDEETEISLQLPVSYPWLSNYSQESSSFVDLYLDPNCVYEVSVYYSLVSWFSQLIRLHWTHFGGLLCGHLLLSLMLVTVKLIKINENNTLLCYRRSLPVHEVYCHLSVVCIHFISFQLIHLPFSEWIELQQYGQLGLRLMTTLQLSVIHQSYLELILAHLPFFIISIPWAFLIPIGNYLLDGFLLFIAQIIQRISSGKQNDNM
ncbi:unnamed protein product [Heterobilharzia americana]|nr:unnamed protein product [Heterobilharzia americana]